jgi:hypothetical protein
MINKLLLAVLLSSFNLLIFAQEKNVVITGRVESSLPDKYRVNEHISIAKLRNFCSSSKTNRNFYYPKKDTIPDSFYFSINVKESLPYELILDNTIIHLYLSPGDSLHVVLDFLSANYNARFTGKGAEINNYLAEKYFNKSTSDNPFRPHRKEYKKMKPSDFYFLCDSVIRRENEKLDKLSKDIDFERLRNYFHTDYSYDIANEQYSYLKTHFKERLLAGESLGPDSSFYWFLNLKTRIVPRGLDPDLFENLKSNIQVSVNDTAAIHSAYYFRFLDNYLSDQMPEYLADKFFRDSSLEFINIHQYRLAKQHFTGIVKDVMLGRILCSAFLTQTENTKAMDSLVNDFKHSKPDTSCLNTVEEKYKDYLKLIKGAPAPDFVFKDQHGKQKSLAAYKGKVVYIVLLSSFNVPSLNEMNSLAALQTYVSNKNVELIYISLDTKKEEWEKNVKEFKIEGEQWLPALENKQDDFSNLYNIRNLPQCILIDKEGHIVSTNARTPSQGIEREIEDLLR